MPIEGWFVDRYGPRVVVLFGGVLVGIAWMLNSVASSLPILYTAAAIGGIGVEFPLRIIHNRAPLPVNKLVFKMRAFPPSRWRVYEKIA